MDDGPSARFAADHFVMSTHSEPGKIMQHLEHRAQVLWPELDVQIVSVTNNGRNIRSPVPAPAIARNVSR